MDDVEASPEPAAAALIATRMPAAGRRGRNPLLYRRFSGYSRTVMSSIHLSGRLALLALTPLLGGLVLLLRPART
jgi:hypothetical protein